MVSESDFGDCLADIIKSQNRKIIGSGWFSSSNPIFTNGSSSCRSYRHQNKITKTHSLSKLSRSRHPSFLMDSISPKYWKGLSPNSKQLKHSKVSKKTQLLPLDSTTGISSLKFLSLWNINWITMKKAKFSI